VSGPDCKSGVCNANVCQPACNDNIKNGDETDVDCGGSCGPCAVGLGCAVPGDCASGTCVGGTCGCGNGPDVVFSEIQSRGVKGGADEFIELYNPTANDITLDNTWTIDGRAHDKAMYSARWTGTGKVIPAHGHFLLVGTKYSLSPAGDEPLTNGVTDAASVRLTHGGATVDVVCYAFDAPTKTALMGAGFVCEGAPADNTPHDNTAAGDINASIQRKPGGAAGNCIDTASNASDFVKTMPAAPQDAMSAKTP
jgi:hypothetical protein